MPGHLYKKELIHYETLIKLLVLMNRKNLFFTWKNKHDWTSNQQLWKLINTECIKIYLLMYVGYCVRHDPDLELDVWTVNKMHIGRRNHFIDHWCGFICFKDDIFLCIYLLRISVDTFNPLVWISFEITKCKSILDGYKHLIDSWLPYNR